MILRKVTPAGDHWLNGRNRNFFCRFRPPAGNPKPDKIIDVRQLKVSRELAVRFLDEIAERSIDRIDPLVRGAVASTWFLTRIFREDLCKCFGELVRSSIRMSASSLLL